MKRTFTKKPVLAATQWDVASIQRFIDSYGFSEFEVYENEPGYYAIDFEGYDKNDVIPLYYRLRTMFGDAVNWDYEYDHYILIELGGM